jgi:hypothetical protein
MISGVPEWLEALAKDALKGSETQETAYITGTPRFIPSFF